jgi:hypothetical protein
LISHGMSIYSQIDSDQFPYPPIPLAPTANLGLDPTIDAVFTITGASSFTMGFEFRFSDDASIKIDPINGTLIGTNL